MDEGRSIGNPIGVADALSKVTVCVRNVGLYGRLHPMIEGMSEAAHTSLTELLTTTPKIVLAVTDSCLIMDSFPIEDSSGCLAAMAKSLLERQVGELEIQQGVTREEIVEFSETLSIPLGEMILRGGMARELNRRNVKSILVRAGVLPAESRVGKDPADIYEEALLLVEEALRAVQSGLQIPVPEIRNVVAETLQSLGADAGALVALAGVKSYDRYLSEHSVNVCILSMVLGKDLGLDMAAALELGISAMLHDVGKVFVSGDVVKKPGRLTEEEWHQIRRHPAEGARVLAGLSDVPPLAATIALEHHLHCDGSGYPSLPADQPAHLLSRLVAIVDTYDALTTDRPYRERWTPQQAIAWMLYEGWRQYDRQLLARFASRANLSALGSVVRLIGGDIAVVVGGSHNHPTRPIIRIVADSDGKKVDPRVIDLSGITDPAFEISATAQPVEILLPFADYLTAA
jgi:HD-GYP domain-containing protein (c-di-GMP phosphodiesterase class II)